MTKAEDLGRIMPELEDLVRMIEQAGRGDWVEDALLRVLAADLIDKGEPLPLPLRSYIVKSLRVSAQRVEAELRTSCVLMIVSMHSCFAYLTGADISRATAADSAVKAIKYIEKLPGKLGRGRRPTKRLRDLVSVLVWLLFLLEYRKSGSEEKLCSWQEATAAVSERLDPDREDSGRGRRRRSGYGERSIAIRLERIERMGGLW